MRLTVEIPADGAEKVVNITGRSLVIEAASTYDSPSDVPLLGFDSGNDQYPIYPRSTYQAQKGSFQKVIITGTAASAGDEIVIVSFIECLPSSLNIVYSEQYQVTLKPTFFKTTTDTAQALSTVELQNADGVLPFAMTIWARVADIHYAFGINPNQLNDAILLPVDGEGKRIEGLAFIEDFLFISESGSTPGNLVVQLEYVNI